MTAPGGGQSAAGETGQSAGVTNPGTETAATTGGQSAPGTTVTTPPADGQSTVTRAEFDQLRSQLVAADQKRTAAEQQLAQLRDKDMPALQKAERDLQVANQTLAERDATIASMQVELAFFKDNTHDWQSAALALQSLDRSKITVDAQGQVLGMKDALGALATAHPYLLKPAVAGEPGTGAPAAPPAPGTPPANGGIGQQQGGKLSQAEMNRRFPATRQRY